MHKLLALILMLVFALTFSAHNIDEADSITAKSAEVSSDSDDKINKEHILLKKLKSTAKKITTAKKSAKINNADDFENEIAIIAQDDDLANVPEIELVVDKNEVVEDSKPLVLTFDPIEYYPNGQNPVCEGCANIIVTETASIAEDTPNVDETDEASQPIVLYLDPIEYYQGGENPVCEECANRLETEDDTQAVALAEEESHPTVYSFDPIEYYPNGENPVCEQCAEHCDNNAM